jgi:hypothetical protein
MVATMKPTSRDWPAIAVTLLAGFTAALTAYNTLNGDNAVQNARLARIEFVLCATDDKARALACDRLKIGEHQ